MFNLPFFLLTGVPIPDYSEETQRRIPTQAFGRESVKVAEVTKLDPVVTEVSPDTCWNCGKTGATFAHRMNCFK